MVNDILEFTRGNPNTIVLVPEDYGIFVQSIIKELRQEAARKSVAVEMPEPPPSIRLPLNPPRLERVFHNLIVNAAEAMPDGGKVTIRFRVTDDTLHTEISDTGRGIAPEILERLFEPFVSHGKPTGTGLGLSICKRIIEEHGGRITARNEPGAGAVFAFSFPLRKAKREA